MPAATAGVVALDNLQALVIEPYRYRLARYLLLALPQGAPAREFLRELLPLVTHGGVDLKSSPPAWLCNVGLTFRGLRQLEPPAEIMTGTLDPQFEAGPNWEPLGDLPGSPSAPANWWEGQFKTGALHCLVQLHAKQPAALDEATAAISQLAARHGVVEQLPRKNPDHRGSQRLDGEALVSGPPQAPAQAPGRGRVHFGYIDGFSRPDVDWTGSPATGQTHYRNFLLGYSDPKMASAPDRGPAAEFFRDSSYMVLRWMYQDVAGFNRFLDESASKVAPLLPVEEGRELVAAKMMGRWRNGTPLVLSPDRPLDELSQVSNSFQYKEEDPHGHRCPFSAHIRVTNPRDQRLNPAIEEEGVPSVIRRGIPYGPEMEPHATEDDGVDRGILGLFLCANIRRQFYTLTHWVAENSFSPVFQGAKRPEDAIFGNRSHPATSHEFLIPQAAGDVRLTGLPDFVRTKGTAFFLLPSMSALRRLAGENPVSADGSSGDGGSNAAEV